MMFSCSQWPPTDAGPSGDGLSGPDSIFSFPSPLIVGQPWGIALAQPAPSEATVVWLRSGTIVARDADSVVFPSFSITDTGTYYCVAYGESGVDSSRAHAITPDHAVLASDSTNMESTAAGILKLTAGRRVRMVWLRGGYSEEGGGTLVGYDSKSDSLHAILGSTGNMWINRPHLLGRGTRVVFTDTHTKSQYASYVVNWDGSGLRHVADGACSDVWIHPQTGEEWAIIRRGGADTANPMYRCPIDGDRDPVLLWDKTAVGSVHSRVWYQVSADGHRAAGCFPWGEDASGVVFNGGLSANGKIWTTAHEGCWYSMAPDNSYYWFFLEWDDAFNGHTSLAMYRDTIYAGRVNLRARDTLEEHLHPKFSANSSRFVVATVGFQENASAGSDSAEIVFGRMRNDMLDMHEWVQITRDSIGDYSPDAWIGTDENEAVVDIGIDSIPAYPPGSLPETEVCVLGPASGASFAATDTVELRWTIGDADLASGWLVDFSTDAGLSWENLNDGSAFSASLRSLEISCARFNTSCRTDTCEVILRISDYFQPSISSVSGSFLVFGPGD
ncbi:MAG: hypothetical protein GF410_06735 [Chitinivibrionales bacterium]|nr:hypothetical protein [Chitinivibrionales bacterium]